jgi:hypothetical protein
MMKIQRLIDGSTKVELEIGNVFYVKKCIDPIDGMIDIGLIQQQTASFLNKPPSADDYLIPETFFYALSRKCFKVVDENPNDEYWHIRVAQEFNLEISRQELLRIGEGLDTDFHFNENAISLKQGYAGKYEICYMDVIPDLSFITSESDTAGCLTEDDATEHETMQYVIASGLLRLIHARLEIRRIEARISELKGMCEYLKLIAPDEFNAYCAVTDNLGLDAELDFNECYELLEQIMQV